MIALTHEKIDLGVGSSSYGLGISCFQEFSYFGCSDELELCWDPLEASYGDMVEARKTLLLHTPVFKNEPLPDSVVATPDSGEDWEEMFVGEPRQVEEEAMLSPILLAKDDTEKISPLQGDVPDLILGPGEHTMSYCNRCLLNGVHYHSSLIIHEMFYIRYALSYTGHFTTKI